MGDRRESTRTVEIGHGRIESRHLTTSEARVGYSDWPGLAQVFEVGRQVIEKKTGKEASKLSMASRACPPSGLLPSAFWS
jgi:hypothetical protein